METNLLVLVELFCEKPRALQEWRREKRSATVRCYQTWMCGCMLPFSHMLDERFHYLVAVRHVRDHVFHVVLGRPDQRRPEHQGQVPGLHLNTAAEDKRRRWATPWCATTCQPRPQSFTHLVFIWMVSYCLQVADQELQSVIIMIWEVSDLWQKKNRYTCLTCQIKITLKVNS